MHKNMNFMHKNMHKMHKKCIKTPNLMLCVCCMGWKKYLKSKLKNL